jgi:hypothetical protein
MNFIKAEEHALSITKIGVAKIVTPIGQVLIFG